MHGRFAIGDHVVVKRNELQLGITNGDLFAVWYNGSGERTADDVKIEGARKRVGDEKWSDRFNGQVTVSGTDNWVVTVTVSSPQRIIATWNASVSYDSSGLVMTATPIPRTIARFPSIARMS